jgi:hypothetical protein
MPHWRLALASLITLPLLTSCAELPAGADGDLTNGWAALPAATQYEPKVGACLTEVSAVVTSHQAQSAVVDCGKTHGGQIVAAGENPAEGSSPEADTAHLVSCDKQATSFLKEDWRNGMLELRLIKPRSATAPDGARWWACIIVAIDRDLSRNLIPLEGDLAAGIPAKLRYSCQTAVSNGDSVKEIKNVDCAVPHHAEYAGSVVLPAGTPYPASAIQWDRIHGACAQSVAEFTGASRSQVSVYSSLIHGAKDWPDWRDVRCFAYFNDKTMTGSAKGTQGAGVPW